MSKVLKVAVKNDGREPWDICDEVQSDTPDSVAISYHRTEDIVEVHLLVRKQRSA